MQKLAINGVDLAYTDVGAGPETVVLSHSYLVDHRQFDAQVVELKKSYRVIAFDHRGHGQSSSPMSSYGIDDLTRDAIRLIEVLDVGPCHFVGLSTGGFVGMRIALRRPDLLKSLVLMDTAADAEPSLSRLKYEGMLAILQLVGPAPLMATTMKTMFGPVFLADPARQEEAKLWRDRIAGADGRSLARFGRAIFARGSIVDRLRAIHVPTLVMVGEADVATSPKKARMIADSIPGAELRVIAGAGHLSTIEYPTAVTRALTTFLAGRS